MAKPSADDLELRRACEAAVEGTKEKIVMSIRVAKSRGIWWKAGKLGRQMAKARVLALSTKAKVNRTKAFLHVLKYSNGGVLEENTPAVPVQQNVAHGPVAAAAVSENDLKVTVEKDLVSQVVEEDVEALLGTYVMCIGEAEAFSERMKRELQALEAANVHTILETEPLVDLVLQGIEEATHCIEDMGEWLGIFNVKLRHMREDIESER